MAKRKFRIRIPIIRLVNRCIICGRVLRTRAFICSQCKRK